MTSYLNKTGVEQMVLAQSLSYAAERKPPLLRSEREARQGRQDQGGKIVWYCRGSIKLESGAARVLESPALFAFHLYTVKPCLA